MKHTLVAPLNDLSRITVVIAASNILSVCTHLCAPRSPVRVSTTHHHRPLTTITPHQSSLLTHISLLTPITCCRCCATRTTGCSRCSRTSSSCSTTQVRGSVTMLLTLLIRSVVGRRSPVLNEGGANSSCVCLLLHNAECRWLVRVSGLAV